MKGIVFATMSCVALLMVSGANAEDAASTNPAAKAPVPAAPAAQPAQQGTSAATMPKSHAPMHSKGAHPAVKHKAMAHKHHHKYHPRHPMEKGYRVPVEGVYVTFPPINECGQPVCNPAYYWGNPECPYLYHGGYFWYPHARADMLRGYTPYYDQRWYWYPSRMHPHNVYIDRTPLGYTHPYLLHTPHPRDRAAYGNMVAPMQKRWDDAPEMRSMEE